MKRAPAISLKRAFRLPEHIEPVAMMPLGYPADNVHPSNWHYRRFPLEDTCTFLKGPLGILPTTIAPCANSKRQ